MLKVFFLLDGDHSRERSCFIKCYLGNHNDTHISLSSSSRLLVFLSLVRVGLIRQMSDTQVQECSTVYYLCSVDDF